MLRTSVTVAIASILLMAGSPAIATTRSTNQAATSGTLVERVGEAATTTPSFASSQSAQAASRVIGPFATGCGEGQGVLVELVAGEYPAQGTLVPYYQRLDVGGGGSWNYMAGESVDLPANESALFELQSPGAGFALSQIKVQINKGTVTVGDPLCV